MKVRTDQPSGPTGLVGDERETCVPSKATAVDGTLSFMQASPYFGSQKCGEKLYVRC